MRYELKIDDLKCWEFTNKDDEKIVKKYLKENKRVEYEVHDTKAKVFIFAGNRPAYIADMVFKIWGGFYKC